MIALLLILAGIAAGRWARQLETPEIKAQMKELQRLYLARSDINRVRNADGVEFLRQEAVRIEGLIEKGSTSEQAVNEQLAAFEWQIDFLARLDAMEVSVAMTKPALSSQISAGLVEARRQLIAGDRQAAQTAFDAVRDVIRNAAKPAVPLLPGVAPDPVASVLLSLGASASTGPGGGAVPSGWSLTKLLAFFTGDPSVGAGLRYWVVKPLLAIVLLGALGAIGLYTLYVKVPTFGSSGMYEYLGLFVWGLGAEAAQRTLTGLQVPR